MFKHASLAALVMSVAALGAAQAAERASKDEAVAMVKKAVAVLKSNDAETTYKAIIAHDPRFLDRDLYIVVYNLSGIILAHGYNPKMVGRDQSDAEDVDGKAYGKERQEKALKQASFWFSYKFVDPLTKKIEPKEMYCERLPESIVCAGVYKS